MTLGDGSYFNFGYLIFDGRQTLDGNRSVVLDSSELYDALGLSGGTLTIRLGYDRTR